MLNLTTEQEEAIELCANPSIKIACVTGQAGTGKTTILRKVYNRLLETYPIRDPEFPTIRLSAPTGRAAKRIEEATNIPAMTVHRMMRFSVPEDDADFGLPAHTKMNPLPYDVIFIDEASMLTEELRRQVIDAIKRGACIRFFGDINQLPPINSASPFAKDLERFPSVTLMTNFRSTDGIISLADRVIKNKMPMNNEQVTIHRVAKTDGSNAVLRLAESIDFLTMANQIICPTNTTQHGTENLNIAIQQKFNPEKEKITIFKTNKDKSISRRSFKRGDKMLWTHNDYNLDIMNGSIGRINSFNTEIGSIFINIDNRDIEIPSQMKSYNPTTGETYTYDPRHYMELGYAISTHKSQGSQFDIVCFVCSLSRAATRQNVYTAVTRAKQRLHIINIGGSLSAAIDNKVDIKHG